MSKSIFQVVPLAKTSFFQKIFKQQPEENAVIELNNLLASKPIRQITIEEVDAIEQKYNINLEKEFRLNLEEFYATYLNYHLADNSLGENEVRNLEHLQHILSLHKTTVDKLYSKIGEDVYRRAIKEAIANGRLTKAKEEFLAELEVNLKLSKHLAEKISKDTREEHVKKFIANILSKQSFSAQEEDEFRLMTESLKVNFQADKKTIDDLRRFKLYWTIDKGELPILEIDIALQKDEMCYFTTHIQWWEQRRNVWTIIDTGPVYLTNKRILFMGNGKNTNIRLDKILSTTQHVDGVEIDKDTGKVPILKPDKSQIDIMNRILKRVLKDY